MKKNIITLGLLILSFGLITSFNAKTDCEVAKAITYSWIQTAGPAATITPSDNEVKIKGMTVHGSNVACTSYFNLDGLSFNFFVSGLGASDYAGFGFNSAVPNTSGSQLGFSSDMAPNFVFWPNLFGAGQMRIWIGQTHDYNQTCYFYQDAACTKNYGYDSTTKTLVFTLYQNSNGYYGGANFRFERYNSSVYKVTLTQLDTGGITPYNPNYNASMANCYVYIPISNMPCIGLADYCYLNVASRATTSSVEITMNNFTNTKQSKPTQTDWTGTTGLSLENTTYGLKANSVVGWGQKVVKNQKVHLDGLSFNFKMAKYLTGDCGGFYFTKNSTLNDGTGFSSSYAPCFSVMMARSVASGTYSSLHVGDDHDCYTKASTIYRDTSLTQAGFSSSYKDLLIAPTKYEDTYYTGFNVLFEKKANYYKVTFTQHTLFGSILGSSAANLYNQGNEKRVAMYFPLSAFNNALDSNGDCYLTVAGFASDASKTTSSYILLDGLKQNSPMLTFCNNLLNSLTCDPKGLTPPNKTYWNTLSSQYSALDTDSKELLKMTKSNSDEKVASTIELALAKYDYICKKYGNSYTNFITRDPSTLLSNESSTLLNNDNSLLLIILISSLVLIATTSVIFIKKKGAR